MYHQLLLISPPKYFSNSLFQIILPSIISFGMFDENQDDYSKLLKSNLFFFDYWYLKGKYHHVSYGLKTLYWLCTTHKFVVSSSAWHVWFLPLAPPLPEEDTSRDVFLAFPWTYSTVSSVQDFASTILYLTDPFFPSSTL